MWTRTLLLALTVAALPFAALAADAPSLLGADDAQVLLITALPTMRADWMLVSAVAAFALLRRSRRS